MQYTRKRPSGQTLSDAFSSVTSNRSIAILSLFVILAALPITILLTNKQTRYYGHAASLYPAAPDTTSNIWVGLPAMGSTFTGTDLLNANPPVREVWNFNIGNPSQYPTIYKGMYFHVDLQPDSRWSPGAQPLSWFQTNHPNWLEYRCDKTTLAYEFNTTTAIPLDTSNPAVLSWLESTFYAPAAASGSYQHLDFDNFQMSNGGFWSGQRCGHWTGAAGSSTWVQQYNGTDDDPNYRANEIAMAENLHNWLHTQYPNVQFAANFSFDNNYPTESDILLSHVDLLFDEQGYTNGNSGPPFYYADGTWLAKTQHMWNFTSSGRAWEDINQFGSSFSTLSNAQKQWAISNYLLIKNNASWIYICGQAEYGKLLMTPEYAAQIGSPINTYYQSQNVYMRDFTNGKAIVNPSSTRSITITLPANTYKDLYGNTLSTSVTLAPVSGIVMLNLNGPVTSVVTPTDTPTFTPSSMPTATNTPVPATLTPTPIATDLIQNGCFSNTGTSWLSPWFFQVQSGAAGNVVRGTYYHSSCPYSARVNINTANSNSWYIQLGQDELPLTAGHTYTITFYAMANSSRSFTVTLQQAVLPYTLYWGQHPSITTGHQWQKFTFSFTPTVSSRNTQLVFKVANKTGSMWFDAVSLQ